MSVPIARSVAQLREIVAAWRREGARIAVVPTMGVLQEGHLSLVRAALEKADQVIGTLFVNRSSSTARLIWPRIRARRKRMPPSWRPLARTCVGLCGAFRPGHFEGVAIVVAKLFLQTGADLAFFGEKDFQQLQVMASHSA
ncbi:pantoate--beta-alanine ligase [Mesorhizobium sp.]|uniref:pantoate--beta-alanine ligase n=1 Tax=Mesorhizobium sp. TaxID=1871066 RepID=UPI00257C5D52|nr:pantoate--beta-alanine ligase [Mesorhizobium sp.]